jgi:large subunit ribosomal protein L29
MEAREIRKLSTADIEKRLEDAREEQFNLRFQRASGQLEDYTQLRRLRRRVARLITILRERKIAEQIGGKEGEEGG